MSNRFHSKFHRANHHTYNRATNPDAGHDPIASRDQPFMGEFVLNGSLSCVAPLSSYAGYFYSTNNAISAISDKLGISVYSDNLALSATSPKVAIQAYATNTGISVDSPNTAILATSNAGTAINANGKNFGILSKSQNYALSGYSSLTGINMTGLSAGGVFYSPTLVLYAGGGGDVIFDADTNINGNLYVSQDTTIMGNLSVLGNMTYLDTLVQETSAVTVTNVGTGPALSVTQTGDQSIVDFYDDSTISLHVDGHTARPGYVGVKTLTPNKELTVNGSISASNDLYATNGIYSANISASGIKATNGFYSTGPYSGKGDGIVLDYDNINETGRIIVGSAGGADNLAFYSNGTTTNTMFISSNGNVGIGTIVPISPLTVFGAISTNNTVYLDKNLTYNTSLNISKTGSSIADIAISSDYVTLHKQLSSGENTILQTVSAYQINLLRGKPNDANNPLLFIGEQGDGSSGTINGYTTGYNIYYDETSNNLIFNTAFVDQANKQILTSDLNGNLKAPNSTYVDNKSILTRSISDSVYAYKPIYSTSLIDGSSHKDNNTTTIYEAVSASLTSGGLYMIDAVMVINYTQSTGAHEGFKSYLSFSGNANLFDFEGVYSTVPSAPTSNTSPSNGSASNRYVVFTTSTTSSNGRNVIIGITTDITSSNYFYVTIKGIMNATGAGNLNLYTTKYVAGTNGTIQNYGGYIVARRID